MNKTDLIEKIAQGAGLTKVDAKKALDATVEAIKGALKKGDKVQLVGFGTFAVTKKPAREGINWRRKWQPTPVFLPGESQGGEAWWAAVYGVAQSRTRLK